MKHIELDSFSERLQLLWFILSSAPMEKAPKGWKKVLEAKEVTLNYKAHRHLTAHLFVVDDQTKTIYLVLPKCACSSIKEYLFRRIGLSATLRKELQHSILPWQTIERKALSKKRAKRSTPVFGITDKDLMADYARKGYFIFSFVRNPYARLSSCFRDKFVFHQDSRSGFYFAPKLLFIPSIRSFRELVYTIRFIPDASLDRHLASQTSFLHSVPDYKNNIHFQGRMESMKKDFQIITARYNNFPMNIHLNKTEKKKGDWRSFYDQELADIVYKRYRKDFEAFNYARDSWKR